MKHILVEWSKGVTQIRSEPETGSEDSLTEQEEIINELYAKLKKSDSIEGLKKALQLSKKYNKQPFDVFLIELEKYIGKEISKEQKDLFKKLNLTNINIFIMFTER